jgi:hypothetical protein
MEISRHGNSEMPFPQFSLYILHPWFSLVTFMYLPLAFELLNDRLFLSFCFLKA